MMHFARVAVGGPSSKKVQGLCVCLYVCVVCTRVCVCVFVCVCVCVLWHPTSTLSFFPALFWVPTHDSASKSYEGVPSTILFTVSLQSLVFFVFYILLHSTSRMRRHLLLINKIGQNRISIIIGIIRYSIYAV